MLKIVYKEAKASFTSDATKVESLKQEISEKFVSESFCLFYFYLRRLLFVTNRNYKSVLTINLLINVFFYNLQHIPEEIFYLVSKGGRIVHDDNLSEQDEIQLAFRLLGGKRNHQI